MPNGPNFDWRINLHFRDRSLREDSCTLVDGLGLAGENRVYYASIEQGRSSASRGGIGAVMGDKGVKAIAVRGTNDINIADEHDEDLINNIMKEYL